MLKELGCTKVHWLPYAVDPTIFREIKDVDVQYDIAFMGSITTERKTLLEKLGRKFRLLTVGHGKGARYMHDASTAYSSSKIVLQISNRRTLGARIFEGMACNRLVMADRIGNGLSDLFLDGENIVLYDVEEPEDKVDHYLSNAEERKRIALQGYNLIMNKHTYRHRVMELLSTVLDSNT
jgi:spore maturation protein CgeB